jgi:hypothetical protein
MSTCGLAADQASESEASLRRELLHQIPECPLRVVKASNVNSTVLGPQALNFHTERGLHSARHMHKQVDVLSILAVEIFSYPKRSPGNAAGPEPATNPVDHDSPQIHHRIRNDRPDPPKVDRHKNREWLPKELSGVLRLTERPHILKFESVG